MNITTMNITNLTTTQLNQIIAIKEQIEALQGQIESIAAGGGGVSSAPDKPTGARKMSRSEAARIAVMARWAKARAAKAEGAPAKKGKRRISAAGRAAMSAAGKARWAGVRAEGRKTL